MVEVLWHAMTIFACSQHTFQFPPQEAKNGGSAAPWVWRCFRRAYSFNSILVACLYPGPCCLAKFSFVMEAAKTAFGISVSPNAKGGHTQTFSKVIQKWHNKKGNYLILFKIAVTDTRPSAWIWQKLQKPAKSLRKTPLKLTHRSSPLNQGSWKIPSFSGGLPLYSGKLKFYGMHPWNMPSEWRPCFPSAARISEEACRY